MIYFAYGSNMDEAAMARLCPRSRALGPGRLMKHRIFVMEEGYASVAHDAQASVHGVIYDLAWGDIPALDRYEEVGRGLYRKVTQPVLRSGAASLRAMLYVGGSQREGLPHGDYWSPILAAARRWEFPAAYRNYLQALGGESFVPASEPRRAIKLKGI